MSQPFHPYSPTNNFITSVKLLQVHTFVKFPLKISEDGVMGLNIEVLYPSFQKFGFGLNVNSNHLPDKIILWSGMKRLLKIVSGAFTAHCLKFPQEAN